MSEAVFLIMAILAATPNAEELERPVLAAHQQIEQMIVEVKGLSTKSGTEGIPHRIEFQSTFYQNRTSRRYDFERTSGSHFGYLHTRKSYGPSGYRSVSFLPDQNFVHARWDRVRSEDEVSQLMPLVDLRLIGIAPVSVSTLESFELTTCMANPAFVQRNVLPKTEMIEGHECYRIRSQFPNGVHVETWIAPEIRAVLRIRTEQTVGQDTLVQQANFSKLKEILPGVWFPERIHTTNQINDLSKSETVSELRYVSVNKPLDDELFTFVGMELPNLSKVRVIERKPGGDSSRKSFTDLRWKGEELVAE